MTTTQRALKRGFDILFSAAGLLALGWLIVLAFLLATIDTRQFGFFTQHRVGRNGKEFKVIKIRTMRQIDGVTTTVTSSDDPRITKLGAFFRRTKIDELPQLINVLFGSMSFVGPRPDVRGFADQLQGRDAKVLSIRPGITGPATLYYKNEEEILKGCDDPEDYNARVIFPKKVELNLDYIENYSLSKDLNIIWQTVLPGNETRGSEIES